MKRKLFTLLLAIGALTAFQTNAQAQTKVRILADKSGLDKTSHYGNDSFPYAKKAELYNWLSFISGETKLKTGSKTDSLTVQDSILIQKELWGDVGSVFKVNFFGRKDSTQFQIIPAKENDPIELRHTKGATNLFSILKLDSKVANNKGDGVLANFPLEWPNAAKDNDTIEGYLAYVPSPDVEKGLKLDTLHTSVALVGVDKKGDLSLKYFNEFAFYADTLPLLLQSFQFRSADTKFHSDRLYRTDSFPYFQLYDKNNNPQLWSSKNRDASGAIIEGGKATNWGHRNGHEPNLNDTCVWSWLDIKLSDDAAIVLPGYTADGRDTSATVRLDTLYGRAHYYGQATNINLRFDAVSIEDSIKIHGKFTNDSLRSWDYHVKESGSVNDTVIYLKKDGELLSFTAKLKHDNKESDWTNGYPSYFQYKGNGTDAKDVYYRVDTSFMALLDTVYKATFASSTTPYDSVGARYVYKNNDDSWRPLYVKVQHVDDSAEAKRKYEYAGTKWLTEKQLLGTRVTQEVEVTGLSDRRITDGHNGDAISLTEGEGASLFITYADSITSTGNKFHTNDYSDLSQGQFENTDKVELFRIKNGDGLYLTVAGKSTFAPPLKNTITWADSITEPKGESVRQLFAIVRNCLDDSYVFLPVAARDWTEGSDSLTFNRAIGQENKDNQIVDIESAWRLEISVSHQVVVADSLTEREPLRFRLSSPLRLWDKADGTIVALKRKDTGEFYRGDGSKSAYKDAAVKNSDIGALWKVERQRADQTDGKYKFVPVVDVRKGTAPFDTILTVYTQDNIDIVFDRNNEQHAFTVVDGFAPEDFDLYTKFDFEWKNDKGLVTVQSGDGRYISYGSTDNPEDVGYRSEASTVTIHDDGEDVLFADLEYPVHYYRFSDKKDKDDYFLKAQGDKISWERVADPEGNDYKFSLPAALTPGKFYLQNKNGYLVQVSKDGTKLNLSTEKDIYGVLKDINDAKESVTLEWTIAKVADLPAQWSTVAIGEDSTSSVGVLALRGAGETFIGRDDNGNGVLRDKAVADRVLLKIKAVHADSPQNIVAAYSQATDESDVRVDYHIILEDSLYLTAREDESVAFEKSEEHNRFAFLTTEDGFAIVYGEEDSFHYLSSTGLSLNFTDDENKRLSFEWGNPDDYGIITGIKVIGVSSQAKVYGVAGGVKVANATGAVAIYTIDGRLVSTQAITSPNQTIAVPAGIYIVRNGAEVAKVIVK